MRGRRGTVINVAIDPVSTVPNKRCVTRAVGSNLFPPWLFHLGRPSGPFGNMMAGFVHVGVAAPSGGLSRPKGWRFALVQNRLLT